MENSVWERLIRSPLYLDQTRTELYVDRLEVEQFYGPLASKLLEQAMSAPRLLAAVAGPPGSGKTSFATLLTAVIRAISGAESAVMIQQDGWHYPNPYLDSHTIEREGKTVRLRDIKGAPETYDVAGAREILSKIRQGEPTDYPVYSRELHNPIPGAGQVLPDQRLIILEGNYWLLREEPWSAFQPMFDITIMLNAPLEALTGALRQRHLRGGKNLQATEQQMAAVDLPNIERVIQHSAPADVAVEKADSQRIRQIVYRSPAAFMPKARRGSDQSA